MGGCLLRLCLCAIILYVASTSKSFCEHAATSSFEERGGHRPQAKLVNKNHRQSERDFK